MRLAFVSTAALLASRSSFALAKSWSFQDATLSVAGKGAGVGGGVKEQLSPSAPLSSPVTLASGETLKIVLTVAEDKTPKRPHQASLLIKEPSSGLEDTFPLTVKESGKAKVELTFKDLPVQFLQTQAPLQASLVIASFGASTPHESSLFALIVNNPDSASPQLPQSPERYAKLPEIHHIFRADPKSPPMIITLVFMALAVITLPVLFGIWVDLGVNLKQLPEAFRSAPISHTVFLASIGALEFIFFLYYKDWKLYQMLPAVGVVGLVSFVSGSRALSEVQSRRLLGKR